MTLSKNQKMFAVIYLAATIIVFTGLYAFSKSNWKLAYEKQAYLKCLPYVLTLMNEKNIKLDDITYGSLVSVNTDNLTKYYGKDNDLLKLVVGMPGDVIDMTGTTVKINNVEYGKLKSEDNLLMAPYSNQKFILQESELFLMGSTPVSLDSRVVGPIKIENIKGKGYALL